MNSPLGLIGLGRGAHLYGKCSLFCALTLQVTRLILRSTLAFLDPWVQI